MTLHEFLVLADEYADMGSAVQEQLRDVVIDNRRLDEQSPHALEMIAGWLDDVSRSAVDDECGANADGHATRIRRYLDAKALARGD